jgi:hypothetical protein
MLSFKILDAFAANMQGAKNRPRFFCLPGHPTKNFTIFLMQFFAQIL